MLQNCTKFYSGIYRVELAPKSLNKKNHNFFTDTIHIRHKLHTTTIQRYVIRGIYQRHGTAKKLVASVLYSYRDQQIQNLKGNIPRNYLRAKTARKCSKPPTLRK